MAKPNSLDDLQLILLSTASQRGDGSLLPFPPAAADAERRDKGLSSLMRRKLVAQAPVSDPALSWREKDDQRIGLFITDAGRAAIGLGEETGGADAEGAVAGATQPPSPAPRSGTKAELVLTLLQRELGATLPELVEATGWLPHTTRAALTGLRKKGHAIARLRRDDVTCYRIESAA